MNYTEEDCKKDTIQHINEVRKALSRVIAELEERGRAYDLSKLKSPELEIFAEYTPKLSGSTYGSDEYHENLKGMQVALKHHYANNSHHPEYYENGIQGMDLLDVLEMFCDWKAATMRHNDGDLSKSVEINKKRFGYSDDLEQIFKNSIRILD